jgi:conjugal transfer mating pair stabilization protein TraG
MPAIYSLGDINFLDQILTGLNMVFGAGDYRAMVSVAALFGALLVFFQSVATGALAVDVPRLFAGWLLWSIAFVPQTEVVITSAYTGASIGPVAIPAGVAYAGSAVSEIGLRMTELFETAFSAPPMSQYGFASSLETIKRVRLNTLSLLQWGGANTPVAGSDVHRSWVNYFKECTIPGLLRGTININQMMQAANFMAAAELVSPVNMARIYIGAGPADLDCTAAWTQLSTFTTGVFLPALETDLANVIPGGPVLTTIGTALNGLGLSGIDPEQFLLASVLVPVYLEASAADAEETYKFSYAKEVSDAIRARNSEWMAGQSIFDAYVSPVLTFIEGFEYAVTPLLVLLLVGGAPVAGIAGRYLYLLVWIQLWYPCMAIVNLYLYNVVSGKLAALASNGSPLSSLAGVMLGDNVVATWLATGGMLAAAVPELALLLVAGGSVVANSFVSHLGRTGTIDPTVAAPREIGQQVSFASFAPLMSVDPTLGARPTGSERVLPEFRFGQDSTALVESARSRMDSSLAEFRSALAQSASNTAGHDARGGRADVFNHSTAATHG